MPATATARPSLRPRRRISAGVSAVLLLASPRRSTTFHCVPSLPARCRHLRPLYAAPDRDAGGGPDADRYQPVAALRSDDDTNPLEESVEEGADEREFELNLGRAIDTLRADYPLLLTAPPDFDIYAEHIVASDPGGFGVVGREAYERANWWLHAAVGILCDVERSGLTFTLVYDWARGDIRVSWHASVMPRSPFATQPVRVDGISVYEYSPSAGKITRHTIDRVNINDVGVRSPGKIFEALQSSPAPAPLPELAAWGDAEGAAARTTTPGGDRASDPPIRTPGGAGGRRPRPRARARKATALAARADDGSGEGAFDGAFMAKNRARARFGLPALSRAEFDAIVAAVGRQAEGGRGRAAAGDAEALAKGMGVRGVGGLLSSFVRDVLKDTIGTPETCESSWDCEAPKNCCDLGFAKICCNSGLGVPTPAALLEPIPVRVTDGYSYPDRFPRTKGPAGY